MSVALLIFWGAVGWCGTPWRWPIPPPLLPPGGSSTAWWALWGALLASGFLPKPGPFHRQTLGWP